MWRLKRHVSAATEGGIFHFFLFFSLTFKASSYAPTKKQKQKRTKQNKTEKIIKTPLFKIPI